jgi:hypothetical protein
MAALPPHCRSATRPADGTEKAEVARAQQRAMDTTMAAAPGANRIGPRMPLTGPVCQALYAYVWCVHVCMYSCKYVCMHEARMLVMCVSEF